MRIRLLCIGYKLRNFPTALWVLMNKRIVKAEFLGLFKCGYFSISVNKQFGSDSRMAVNVLSIIGSKVAR